MGSPQLSGSILRMGIWDGPVNQGSYIPLPIPSSQHSKKLYTVLSCSHQETGVGEGGTETPSMQPLPRFAGSGLVDYRAKPG